MQALSLPSEKALVLEQVADHLGAIPNVAAVVLGGSYAREFARPDSDLDIGIYLSTGCPLPGGEDSRLGPTVLAGRRRAVRH